MTGEQLALYHAAPDRNGGSQADAVNEARLYIAAVWNREAECDGRCNGTCLACVNESAALRMLRTAVRP